MSIFFGDQRKYSWLQRFGLIVSYGFHMVFFFFTNYQRRYKYVFIYVIYFSIRLCASHFLIPGFGQCRPPWDWVIFFCPFSRRRIPTEAYEPDFLTTTFVERSIDGCLLTTTIVIVLIPVTSWTELKFQSKQSTGRPALFVTMGYVNGKKTWIWRIVNRREFIQKYDEMIKTQKCTENPVTEFKGFEDTLFTSILIHRML